MFKKLKNPFLNFSKRLASFSIGDKIKSLFSLHQVDETLLETFEQLLYEADIGVQASSELTEKIRMLMKKNSAISLEKVLAVLKNEFLEILTTNRKVANIDTIPPEVILVVGTNGSGKTTSLAKLAYYYQKQGKKVLIAAADTYRAAAVEQLTQWAEKLHIDIVKSQKESDPAAVVFDALVSAKAKKIDVVLIDTAGRLHTKEALMHELEKIRKICVKQIESAPHETLLTLDATTGQNGLDQARIFNQFTPITGIILTKFDGSAKGGITVAIKKELNLDVQWIGTGEKVQDLEPFDPLSFVQDLLSSQEA